MLISIKPHFVNAILSGDKRYEFRKRVPKRTIDRVYIYSSSPEMRIVGRFRVEQIHERAPGDLWTAFWMNAGIDEDEFFDYFSGKGMGYAMEIADLEVFEVSRDPKEVIPDFKAPQDFMYLPEGFPETLGPP